MTGRRKRIFTIFLTLFCVCVFSMSAFAASPQISKKKATISIGKTMTLKISKAGKSKITWKSSKPKIASVSKKGQVKGLKAGKAVISAKVGKKTLKCTVTVKAIRIKKITLNKKSCTMTQGEKFTLKASFSPKDASNRSLTWKSSNKKVATVDSKGVVKAVSPGKATITATAKDGSKKKASCTVTVKKKAEKPASSSSGSSASKTPTLKITNAPVTLKVAYYAYLNYDCDVNLDDWPTWKSSDTKVLEIDPEEGVIFGARVGKATVTCTGKYHGKTISASVTVTVVKYGDMTNFYEKEEKVAQVKKELAAAKARGPKEYIQYCETHPQYLDFSEGRSEKFIKALMSGDFISYKIDVTVDYKKAVDALYIPWIKELLKKSGCDYTNDPLCKLLLLNGTLHVMEHNGELKYGGRTAPYGLCPYVAPLMMEGKCDGTYQFGNCQAFSRLVGDAAQILGFEVRYITPEWGGDFHIAAQVRLNGYEYIFDPLYGFCQGVGEAAAQRLDKACEEASKIRNNH